MAKWRFWLWYSYRTAESEPLTIMLCYIQSRIPIIFSLQKQLVFPFEYPLAISLHLSLLIPIGQELPRKLLKMRIKSIILYPLAFMKLMNQKEKMHLVCTISLTPKVLKHQCDQETKDQMLGKNKTTKATIQIRVHPTSTKGTNMVLFLTGCLKLGHHHESNSNFQDNEVHDQPTTSAETNGHWCSSPQKGNSS